MDFSHGVPLVLLTALALVLLSLLASRLGIFPGGRIDLRRSVLVHTPADAIWRTVSDVPALHAAHGRIADFGRITGWSTRRGDGAGVGSMWRVSGTWAAEPYWADIEIVRTDRGREIAFRLHGDSLGTHRGLQRHLGSLTLDTIDAGTTKVTWRLSARLRAPRLVAWRLLSPRRLRARLLDQGLRSLKVEIEGGEARRQAARAAERDEGDDLAVAGPPHPPRRPPESTI